MTENSLAYLKEIYDLLVSEGINTYVFGGWAEELRGIAPPRSHKDVDLLYSNNDLVPVDAFIKKYDLKPIKIFPHKRAFLYRGIMVEIFLVTNNTTNFFDTYLHEWPNNTFEEELVQDFHVCSTSALREYRTHHHLVEEAGAQYKNNNI